MSECDVVSSEQIALLKAGIGQEVLVADYADRRRLKRLHQRGLVKIRQEQPLLPYTTTERGIKLVQEQ